MARVLAVDDDPVVLRLLQVNLELEGHEVVLASDGAEAVTRAREHRPAIILMDVMMPDVDGLAACRAIKQDPDLSAIPVIIISAKAYDRDVDAGVRAGAEAYITKPFDPIDLLDLVSEVLEESRTPPSS